MHERLFKARYLKMIILILSLSLIAACTNTASSSDTKDKDKLVFVQKEDKANKQGEPKKELIQGAQENKEKEEKLSSQEGESPNQVQNQDQYHELSFLAVGDVMVHKAQLKQAYLPATDQFDFKKSFEYVMPFIESANFSFANLETTLAGRQGNPKGETENTFRGYSGYPTFNSPDSLADALKWAGFDFIGTANNHSLDKGLAGVENTLAYLREIGLPYTGTFDSPEERNQLKVVEVNGVKIGVIAYTYATNGISLKAEEMYRVNTLNNYQPENILDLYDTVKRARQEPIDLLFVMMHYGNEYWEKPEKNYQAGISQELINLGVDMVIGSHPHTLQPLIYTENDSILLEKSSQAPMPVSLYETHIDGNKDKEDTGPIGQTDDWQENLLDHDSFWNIKGIYSLGNFISSQRVISEYKTDTDTGAMIKWVYQWKNDDPPTLVKIGIMPTIVVWQKNRATILPINPVSLAAAQADPGVEISPYVESRIANAQQSVLNRLVAFLPDTLISSMQKEGDEFTYIYLHPEIKGK